MNGVTGPSSLNRAQRRRDLERLAGGEILDLLVIGGGITGAGVALDAASRGLSVALVERDDLASGTSRWSSKLIHGGLRYLRHLQVDLAWESAVERRVLLTVTAPHLVEPMPFVAPLGASLPPLQGRLTEGGIRAGDLLRMLSRTPRRDLPAPRRISSLEAARLVPAVCREGLRGAILFWDGRVEDDARLVVAVARTAALHGALVVTRCEAVRVDGEAVTCNDRLSGRSLCLRARTVVNATGVWAGRIEPSLRLRPSKGAHLLLDAAALGNPRAALVVPVHGKSARWVGATPVGDGRVLLGVTDDAYAGSLDEAPVVTDAEEAFLLDTLSTALQRPLSASSVLGRYAGLRPLLEGGDTETADLSRRHAIVDSGDDGMLTLVGGKLTTYRRMAEDVVDRVMQRLGRTASCRTARLPLVGAAPRALLREVAAPARLVRRYGTEAPVLTALAAGRPELLDPVAPGLPVLGVELLFGLLHEGALDADDLLERRVRLGLVPAERQRAEAAAEDLLQATPA